jgi:two-component system osmolarity sensor histidine kinase EnvZ
MTRFATGWERPARKVLPRSLLGRSLLIILVPLVVVQGVALAYDPAAAIDAGRG